MQFSFVRQTRLVQTLDGQLQTIRVNVFNFICNNVNLLAVFLLNFLQKLEHLVPSRIVFKIAVKMCIFMELSNGTLGRRIHAGNFNLTSKRHHGLDSHSCKLPTADDGNQFLRLHDFRILAFLESEPNCRKRQVSDGQNVLKLIASEV